MKTNREFKGMLYVLSQSAREAKLIGQVNLISPRQVMFVSEPSILRGLNDCQIFICPSFPFHPFYNEIKEILAGRPRVRDLTNILKGV